VVPSVQPAGAMVPDSTGAIERLTTRSDVGTPTDPTSTLAGTPPTQPAPPGVVSGLPPGAYASPWTGDKPGCCGPLGGGPIGYELYVETGPNIIGHNSQLGAVLHTGWMVGVGTRSFLFNTDANAAWTLNLGISYTFNRADQSTQLIVVNKGSSSTVNGTTQTTPPTPQQFVLRDLDRTSFNFGIGRDWWIWGPGASGYESGWNWRIGPEIGGRWGTAHVDMIPLNVQNGYFRRQDVYHSIYGGVHSNVEVPIGSWIWFSGVNIQYGYDWTNLIPPLSAGLGNVNLMMTTGVRF
jgi:hypothetical protein